MFSPLAVLVLDVIQDGMFVDTDGRNKVSSGPEVSFGKSSGLFFEPVCRFRFQYLNGVGYRIFRWNDDVEVDMIISDMPSHDGETFPFADEFEYSLEFLFHAGVGKNFSSVPGNPHHMVLTYVGGMFRPVEFG